MITAAGAGAAYCVLAPQRLRPRTPKSPRAGPPHLDQNPPPLPVQPFHLQPPQIQESSSQVPPILQSYLNQPKASSTVASTSSPSFASPPSLIDHQDDYDADGKSLASVRQDDFFRTYHTPSLLQDYSDDPPSPKSFYSVGTSSSGGTARAVAPGRSSVDSIPPLPPGDLHSSPPPSSSRSHSQGRREHLRDQHLPLLNLSGDLHSSDDHALGLSGYGMRGSKSKTAGSGMKDGNVVNNYPRELCIAVVGASGAGKSSFIQKAYDLNHVPTHNVVYTRTQPFDKYLYEVKAVEVALGGLVRDNQFIDWPRTEDGSLLPPIDGVLVLYDVTNRGSIEEVPKLLAALSKANIPFLLVSCKCDAPVSSRRIDPHTMEQLGLFSGVETLSTSMSSPGSQKRCIHAIIAAALNHRSDKNPRYLGGRRRANSSADRQPSPRPHTSTSGHSRASSEFAGTFLNDYSPTSPSSGISHLRLPRSNLGNVAPNTPSSVASATAGLSLDTASATRSRNGTNASSSGANTTLEIVTQNPFSVSHTRHGSISSGPTAADSFLDIDDDSLRDPDDVPILEREVGALDEEDDEETKLMRANGFTWDELVDKLLQQTMSKTDNFVTTFLCLYRKIAPPRDLLEAILDRFYKANTDETITVHRIEKQTRFCTVLAQWISSHPGDFTYPATKQRLQGFISAITSNRSFALLAREMSQSLTCAVKDEDACWGRSDDENDRPNSMSSFLTESSKDDGDTLNEFFSESYTENEGLKIPDTLDTRRPSYTPSQFSISTTSPMVPSPLQIPPGMPVPPGVRDQYTALMAIPEEFIANELTRLDWEAFSHIHSRDLIRHISINQAEKDKNKSLEHVNRMISQFNHVAYWVASLILEKPKAKHRARVLEKFMNVAWLLRHKNNYNALGAVIAGINNVAVARLTLTRELVSREASTRFMRLELLMSTHKSHFAYRLAWENTSSHRIPFIPLHRRDLVSADEGNRTFLTENDRINWNKFQVMGEILQVISKSQATPYPDLQRNPIVEKLILDSIVSTSDDELMWGFQELYDRSVQLENSGNVQAMNTGPGPSDQRRRRMWFQRS